MLKSNNIYTYFSNFVKIKNNIDKSSQTYYTNNSLWNKNMFNYVANKYFDEIYEYNKNIVSYRQSFFKNVSTDDLKNLLHTLSYNLDFNTTNYRWGKRFFDKNSHKFTWTSSTNKQIQMFYWDKNSRQNKSYYKDVYFTDNNINSHFLSCYNSNRKIGFYYSLNNEEKQELKPYIISLENMYKINDKTFGASQCLNSDILLIDIDNHKDRSALETLMMLLDYLEINVSDLIMLEQNVFTGGIHTAIKLCQPISNTKFYSDLMVHLKSLDIMIECNFINNFLRLPLSYEYVAIQKYDKIFNYNEFIPQELWEKDFNDYINHLNLNVCNSNILNKMIAEYHTIKEPNKWANYWKTSKKLFKRPLNSKKEIKPIKLYEITNSHRYETMSKMIPMLKGLGYSLDETVKTIREQNINSKDLSKWSNEKLKRNITNFYNKCNITITKTSSYNGFVSNIENLPKQTLEFLSSAEFEKFITDRFITNYISERNKHNMYMKELSKEKKEILSKQIPYYIKHIIGMMFYHINTPKISLVSERVGFQISDKFLSKLQEQSIIDLKLNKDNSLTKTSLQYLKKSLLKTLTLKEIAYKNRKRNWMLGSCKSYEINSLNDIYNLINHLFNCIYGKKITDKFPHILYILLGGKQDFLGNEDFNIMKKIIDMNDDG